MRRAKYELEPHNAHRPHVIGSDIPGSVFGHEQPVIHKSMLSFVRSKFGSLDMMSGARVHTTISDSSQIVSLDVHLEAGESPVRNRKILLLQ